MEIHVGEVATTIITTTWTIRVMNVRRFFNPLIQLCNTIADRF